MAREHLLAVVVDLDLEQRLAAPGLLEPEVETPDAREQRARRPQVRRERRVRSAKRC